jgi:hypothetical protein
VRAAEKHGRAALDKIAADMEGKSPEEVEAYSKVGAVWSAEVLWRQDPHTAAIARRAPECPLPAADTCACMRASNAGRPRLQVFWARHTELSDWERIIKNIERGEQKIQRQVGGRRG